MTKEKKKNIGLVLEGGGMRGVYTAGVLQYFMEQGLYLPYVIGVSAGACQGCSYVSKQLGRTRQLTIDYIDHPRYISYRHFLRKGELFDMDFVFHELPMVHVPFDYETFRNSQQKFLIGATDAATGKPAYFDKDSLDIDGLLTIVRASSSLPYMAPKVEFQGKSYLDGGISDPIPIKKSEADGNVKNVIILTRNQGYRKSKSRGQWFIRGTNRRYQALGEALIERGKRYNETLDYVEEQVQRGNVFVIRPSAPLEVKRIEKDKAKLEKLYEQGYEDAKSQYGELLVWLKKNS